MRALEQSQWHLAREVIRLQDVYYKILVRIAQIDQPPEPKPTLWYRLRQWWIS
ncbi:MAG: hypothetical protein RR185_10085 [Angelakisella sp.]